MSVFTKQRQKLFKSTSPDTNSVSASNAASAFQGCQQVQKLRELLYNKYWHVVVLDGLAGFISSAVWRSWRACSICCLGSLETKIHKLCRWRLHNALTPQESHKTVFFRGLVWGSQLNLDATTRPVHISIPKDSFDKLTIKCCIISVVIWLPIISKTHNNFDEDIHLMCWC